MSLNKQIEKEQDRAGKRWEKTHDQDEFKKVAAMTIRRDEMVKQQQDLEGKLSPQQQRQRILEELESRGMSEFSAPSAVKKKLHALDEQASASSENVAKENAKGSSEAQQALEGVGRAADMAARAAERFANSANKLNLPPEVGI